jgi:hypothetical protein
LSNFTHICSLRRWGPLNGRSDQQRGQHAQFFASSTSSIVIVTNTLSAPLKKMSISLQIRVNSTVRRRFAPGLKALKCSTWDNEYFRSNYVVCTLWVNGRQLHYSKFICSSWFGMTSICESWTITTHVMWCAELMKIDV